MSLLRKMVCAAVACVVLTSLAGATDLFEDLPPGDMGLVYQEHNYNEPGPGSSLPEMEDSAMRGLVLYKLLTAVRNQAVAPNVLAGPKWISSETEMAPPETFDMPLVRGPMMKRASEKDRVVPKVLPIPKPAQKWKLRKGKVDSSMICYFKLCAFRPPM